jgi:hypothetical protein
VADVIREIPTAGHKTIVFRLRFIGDLQPRSLAANLRVQPLAMDGTRLPSHELPIKGELVRDVTAVPSVLHSGRREVGTSVSEGISFRSLTDRPFAITHVGTSTASVSVARLLGHPSGFLATLLVTERGEQSARLDFTVRESDGAQYRVSVPFAYEGVPAR